MMVKRGPQFVQVMNGWRWRRSAGSASSRRQSAHVATSGEASVRPARSVVDGPMRKPVPPRGATSMAVMRSTTASGGGSLAQPPLERLDGDGAPSTSTTTPAELFVTEPASISSLAVA